MKSDSEIERDVRDELKLDPDLDADDIAVSVKNGVLTLAGFTKSYTDRWEAEAAAKEWPEFSQSRMISRCACQGSIGVPIQILREMRLPR